MKIKIKNLSDIIQANECPTTAIDTSILFAYKKALYVYYKDLFCCEPVILVTTVFNAVSYAKIVPYAEYYEAICEFLAVPYIVEDKTEEGYNEDIFSQYESINFNSKLLKDFLTY
jgi:hypothetical protein